MIYALLTSGHPQIKPTTLYTFLWCLWKARNDTLFCRKVSRPSQVFAAANAIISATKLEIRSSTDNTTTCKSTTFVHLLRNLLSSLDRPSLNHQLSQAPRYSQMRHGYKLSSSEILLCRLG
jgi:hypothetical protein